MSSIFLPKDSVLTLFFNYTNTDLNFSYNCFQSENPINLSYKIYYKTLQDIELHFIDVDCIFLNVPEEECNNRYKILSELNKKYNDPIGYINQTNLNIIIFDSDLVRKIDYTEANILFEKYIKYNGLSWTGKIIATKFS